MMSKLNWLEMTPSVAAAIRKAFFGRNIVWQVNDCDLPPTIIGWHTWAGRRQPVWEADGFVFVGVGDW